ncbi:MAG: helix-hairpin-helix domain-containing protein [Candidatus Acidiferrales bacterium]
MLRSENRANYFLICGATFLFLACALSIASAQKKPPSKPIELNTATIEQLEQLPGIGPGTAKAIVRFREKSGPFERVEDLLAIRGISKARLEKLRPFITVSPPPKKSQ